MKTPMSSYEDEILRGVANGIAGHNVTNVRAALSRIMPENALVPAHRVVALTRVFGEQVEKSFFVVTVGLGAKLLGSSTPSSLSRFELLAWVDTLELPGLNPADVLAALASLGRIIHGSAKPGSRPWQLGDLVSLPENDGMAGWNRFLLA